MKAEKNKSSFAFFPFSLVGMVEVKLLLCTDDIAAIAFHARCHHLVTNYFYFSALMLHVRLEDLKYIGMEHRKVLEISN